MMKRNLLLFILLACSTVAQAGMDDWLLFTTRDGQFLLDGQLNGVDCKVSLENNVLSNSVNTTFLDKHDIPHVRFSRFTLTLLGAETGVSDVEYFAGDADVGLRFRPWFKTAPLQQIDFANKRLRYLPSKSVKMYSNDNVDIRSGTTTSLELAAATMVAEKRYFLAMPEPRSTFTTVSRKLAIKSGWLNKYRIDRASLGDEANDLEGYDFMLVPDFTLGPFEFEQAVVMTYRQSDYDDLIVTDQDNLRSDTRFFDGVLGMDVLSNFVVTVDHNRRNVHIDLP